MFDVCVESTLVFPKTTANETKQEHHVTMRRKKNMCRPLAFFETTASAFDLASGSVLSSETQGVFTQSTRKLSDIRGAKLA